MAHDATKKLNAKRTKAQITYEFLDGTEEKLTVQSLSTSEFEAIGESRIDSTGSGSESNKKAIQMLLVKNETAIVERIIKEQFEEGNFADFTMQLFEIINEEKKGKSKG